MDASNYLTPRHHIVTHSDYEQVAYRGFDAYDIEHDDTSSASLSGDLRDVLDRAYAVSDATVESGMIHLPNHLTTKRAMGFKWNLPMDVRETWKASDFNTLMNSLIRTDDLYADFIRSATLNAKVLIKELFNNQNKISASNVGGVAGGTKFIKDSILFKFNLDSNSIYGGSFLAFKAGRRELVNTMLLNENLYPDFPKLSVPIFAIVEYCGYQISCVGLLPIARSTQGLCYGSSDGGRTVAKNLVIADDAEKLAHMLNLAPHVVGEERVVLSHCVDIEIHEGSDGAFYIIDTARLMPPEYPSPGQPKSIFYYTLRPEFVMQYHKPLCPDGLSNFLSNDPNRSQFDADIRQATELLLNWHVPLACQELDRRLVGVMRDQIVCVIDPELPFAIRFRYEIEYDYSQSLPTSRVLTEFMHERGINLRHLGLMYYHIKSAYWKRAILHEIIARSAKNTLRSLLKYTVDEEESVDEAALMRAQIEFLNLLFGDSIDSDEYWENEFSTTIYKLYFAKAHKAKDEMIAAKFSFKTDLDKKHLLSLLSRQFETTFVNDKFVHAAAFKSSLPFTKETSNTGLPEQYVTNFTLGQNMSIKKFGAIYSLVYEFDL